MVGGLFSIDPNLIDIRNNLRVRLIRPVAWFADYYVRRRCYISITGRVSTDPPMLRLGIMLAIGVASGRHHARAVATHTCASDISTKIHRRLSASQKLNRSEC